MKDLEGIPVVAIEQAVAAPYAAGRLADAGARGFKIERPQGDFARGYDDLAKGNSAYFVWLNRGKESIALDLKTPQDLSLIDARKGLNMFNKVSVPILGIIENMSTFICPSCGERSDIFGHGGAEAEAAKLGVPFLGGVPLHMDIRANSDAGTPVVASDPDGPHAMIYNKIAAQVADALNAEQASGPAIVFE